MPSVTCYCANYYANCIHTSRKEDLQNALSQGDPQWVENVLREQLRREEEKTRRDRVRRSSSGGVR
ncbi:hypothetical protein BUE80_DR012921 [Diplocarpon rosae]|nr:hypothetical protein BUE80_DR012921 [Diplocarpon rosae]